MSALTVRSSVFLLLCAAMSGCTASGTVIDNHLLPNNQATITGNSYSTDPAYLKELILEAAQSVCRGGEIVSWELNPPHVYRMAVGSSYAAVIQCHKT